MSTDIIPATLPKVTATPVTQSPISTAAPAPGSPIPPPPPRHDRRRLEDDRRQLQHVSSAPDHAAQEPEPALSARHQPVHPAAGLVRGGRAADQHEHAAEDHG